LASLTSSFVMLSATLATNVYSLSHLSS
jgi:hypothetical protein